MKKKYVIFGATGSIGSSLANQLYSDKLDCHLIGRNEDELKNISKKLNYTYSVCDVLKINFTDNLKKDLDGIEILGIAYCIGSIDIKPFKLNDVKKALEDIGIQGMSVSEVRGYGRQKGQSELYRGEEYEVAFLPKIRIEVATTNEIAEKMIPSIIKAAQTGKVGDGKILVSDLENVYRIRTEESGIDALAEYI